MPNKRGSRDAAAHDLWELATDLEGAFAILSGVIDAVDILSGDRRPGTAKRRLAAICALLSGAYREMQTVDRVSQALYVAARDVKSGSSTQENGR